MDIDILIRALQGSIAPCVFISATGLLILAMTNRLGRSTDRIRHLCSILEKDKTREGALKNQIDVLYKRCQWLQIGIALTVLSIFFVSIVILMLFSTYVFSLSLGVIIKFAFGSGLICLVFAMIFFLADIIFTLKSLRLEIESSSTTNAPA